MSLRRKRENAAGRKSEDAMIPLPAEKRRRKSVEAKIQKLKSKWNICYYLVSAGDNDNERHIRKSLACAKRLAECSGLEEKKNCPGKNNA